MLSFEGYTRVEGYIGFSPHFSFCRWRDVKLCAFENADHRTYVDLKVKTCFVYHLSKMFTTSFELLMIYMN